MGNALILPAAGAKILRICYLIIHNSGIITNYPYPIIHHPEIWNKGGINTTFGGRDKYLDIPWWGVNSPPHSGGTNLPPTFLLGKVHKLEISPTFGQIWRTPHTHSEARIDTALEQDDTADQHGVVGFTKIEKCWSQNCFRPKVFGFCSTNFFSTKNSDHLFRSQMIPRFRKSHLEQRGTVIKIRTARTKKYLNFFCIFLTQGLPT